MTEKSVSGQYTVQLGSESGFSGAPSKGGAMASGSGGADAFEDRIVLYCSYFAYAPDGHQKRQEILLTPTNDIILRIQRLEQQGVVAKDTAQNITIYLEGDENFQREIFDNSQVSLANDNRGRISQ